VNAKLTVTVRTPSALNVTPAPSVSGPFTSKFDAYTITPLPFSVFAAVIVVVCVTFAVGA
jgi:hypothetical protein